MQYPSEAKTELSKEPVDRVFVYILRLDRKNYYTGITGRLKDRMREHKKGESKSTRMFKRKELVWLSEYETRGEARELEVRIKKRGAKRFMKTYTQGNHGDVIPLWVNAYIFGQ